MNETNKNIFSFSVQDAQENTVSLEQFKGKVLLIVNTASRCGFTPQYQELEVLYQKYKDKGFTILAFPCNQFKNQEPGSNQEIQNFCTLNYKVTFPIFAKIKVNGENAHPLYQYLKSQQKGVLGTEKIKWNFTKFLTDKEGHVRARFAPMMKPLSKSIGEEIELLLTTMQTNP